MSAVRHFSYFSRLLHWVMALLIVAMLFVGVGMVSTVSVWHDRLISVHRPLGVAILLLAIIRLLNRFTHPAPALPADVPGWQRLGGKISHVLLYMLMFAMPLIGWAMLSAAAYPIVLIGPFHLPRIAPHDVVWHTWLQLAHMWLAQVFFAVILLHLAAALFHGLIRRDGVLQSMAAWRIDRSSGHDATSVSDNDSR